MGRYVKSISDTTKLTKSIEDLAKEFSYHKEVVAKNNKELQKLNDEILIQKESEVKKLENTMKRLETQTRWVQNSEPALKLTDQYMLKKLDIL